MSRQLAVTLCAAILAGGCGGEADQAARPGEAPRVTPATTVAATPTITPAPTASPAAERVATPVLRPLQAALAELERGGAAAGVAVWASGGAAIARAGSLRAVHAWSTMKVPLVVAVLSARRAGALPGGRTPTAAELAAIGAAISASDNAAAQQLYGELVSAFGGHDAAIARIQAVIERAGDRVTRVQAAFTRPGLTNFGQTRWLLTEIVRFHRALAAGCLARRDDTRTILAAMRAPAAVQRWGAVGARWPATAVAVKGGWGPATDGGPDYEVLQAAIVGSGSSVVVMALATAGPGTTLAVGEARLTRLAQAVAAGTDRLPEGAYACRA